MQFVAAQLSNYHIKAHPKHGARSRTLTHTHAIARRIFNCRIVVPECNIEIVLFCYGVAGWHAVGGVSLVDFVVAAQISVVADVIPINRHR